jgi:serine/threonine protein kinase/tetratricopeptide (TPR) repeat protein
VNPTSGAGHDTNAPQHTRPAAPPTTPARPAAAKPPVNLPGYAIVGELGRGGMGVVYQARQTGLNRLVALKMILSSSHASSEDLARFKLEAEAVARLRHPHIVQIYDIGQHNGLPYFSLELCSGGTLAEHLDGTPLPPKIAVRLLEPITRAVQAAHEQGIIHRDLKPANILLQANSADSGSGTLIDPGFAGMSAPTPRPGSGGWFSSMVRRGPTTSGDLSASDGRFASLVEKYTPKLTDFGLAKEVNTDSGQTNTGAILGTPSYMAPEQADSLLAAQIGPVSDVWALGAILYELFTGRPPFKGPSPMATVFQLLTQEPVAPTQLQPGLPRDLETIVLKCLTKEPGKRYASAQALAADLGRFLAGEPILARPVGPMVRTLKWARRHPAVAVLTLGLVAVTTVGGAVVLWQWREAVAAYALAEQRAKAESTQRARAEEQEAAANAARLQAEQQEERAARASAKARQALDTLTDEVVERLLARQAQLDDREEAFLKKVLGFYQELAADSGATPAERLANAQATVRAGRLRVRLGLGLDEARQAFVQAVNALRGLAQAQPKFVPYRLAWIDALEQLAQLQQQTTKLADADKTIREARSLLVRLGDEFPQELRYQALLARNHDRLGQLLWARGKKEDALGEGKIALIVWRRVLAEEPTNAEYLAQVAQAHTNLGQCLRTPKSWPDSVQEYQAALVICRKLHTANPTSDEAIHRLAQALGRMGEVLSLSGAPNDAQTQQAEASKLITALVAAYPSVPAYKATHAELLLLQALHTWRLGKIAEAKPLFEQAETLAQQLVTAYPKVPDYCIQLANTYHEHGTLLRMNRDGPAAEELWRKSLACCEQLAKNFPDRLKYREDRARALGHLGFVRLQLRRYTPAIESFLASVAAYDQLAQDDPQTLHYAHEAIAQLHHAGQAYRDDRQLALARTTLQKVLERAERFPNVPELINFAASAKTRLAGIELLEGNADAALSQLDEVHPLHVRLASQLAGHPLVLQYLREHWEIRAQVALVKDDASSLLSAAESVIRLSYRPTEDTTLAVAWLTQWAAKAQPEDIKQHAARAVAVFDQALKAGGLQPSEVKDARFAPFRTAPAFQNWQRGFKP